MSLPNLLKRKTSNSKRQKLFHRLSGERAYTAVEVTNFSGPSRAETQALLEEALHPFDFRIPS